MTIAIVLSKKKIERTDKQDLHLVELFDGTSAFVPQAEFSKFKVGTTVIVTTRKYKGTDGSWKSSKTITPISLGS